jgi:hypothetical protein
MIVIVQTTLRATFGSEPARQRGVFRHQPFAFVIGWVTTTTTFGKGTLTGQVGHTRRVGFGIAGRRLVD